MPKISNKTYQQIWKLEKIKLKKPLKVWMRHKNPRFLKRWLNKIRNPYKKIKTLSNIRNSTQIKWNNPLKQNQHLLHPLLRHCLSLHLKLKGLISFKDHPSNSIIKALSIYQTQISHLEIIKLIIKVLNISTKLLLN